MFPSVSFKNASHSPKWQNVEFTRGLINRHIDRLGRFQASYGQIQHTRLHSCRDTVYVSILRELQSAQGTVQ